MIRFCNITILILLLVVTINPVLADESRRVMVCTESGAFLEYEHRSGHEQVLEQPVESMGNDILWHHNQAAILYSTCISLEDRILTGAADGLAIYEVDGDGTALWTVSDGMTYTAAATDADIFGSATVNDAVNGASISAWEQGDDRPLWTADIPDCYVPALCVKVSRDGSILTAALNMVGTYVKLCSFDVATGDKISTFDCAAPSSARALEISDDGSLVLVRASATLYVVETATGTMRWSNGIGASADPLAFSGDGNVIASGWTSMLVYRWNGSTYQYSWSNNGGGSGWYLRSCALSADGSSLVAGWNSSSYNQNKIQWYDSTDSEPSWTYLAEQSSGSYQELPSGLDVDRTGEYAVVGAWGDAPGTNPEVLVFKKRSPIPVCSIDSPGSIFDVAICSAAGGGVYVSACGKHVHANEMGSGGDVYSAAVDVVTAVPDEIVELKPALGVFPNPFNPRTTLRCRLLESSEITLDIYSTDGRLLQRLAQGTYPSGHHDFFWSGTDDGGRTLPSGVYLARLGTPRGSTAQRLVLVR